MIGSIVGARPSGRMVSLGQCSACTTYSLKKTFSLLIKASFYHQYQYPCPVHLHKIKDLSFVPKLLNCGMQWKEVDIRSLMVLLRLDEDQLDQVIKNPQVICEVHPGGCEASHALLDYRLTIQQDLPTRLKHLYSWNLNSWRAPEQPVRDPKTRRSKRFLRTGPVCLQETKWDNSVPERLAAFSPGVTIFTTSFWLGTEPHAFISSQFIYAHKIKNQTSKD